MEVLNKFWRKVSNQAVTPQNNSLISFRLVFIIYMRETLFISSPGDYSYSLLFIYINFNYSPNPDD